MRGMDGVLQLEFEYIWSFDRIPLAIDQLFASWFWHDLLWTRFEQKRKHGDQSTNQRRSCCLRFQWCSWHVANFPANETIFSSVKACLWPRTRKAISHHCRLEFKTHPRLDSVALHARTSWHKLALARTSEKLNAFKWHLLSWRGFCFWKGRHQWVPTSIGHMHHTLSYSVQLSIIDTLLSVHLLSITYNNTEMKNKRCFDSPILQWLFSSEYCGSDVHPSKQHSWEWLQLHYHNTVVSSGKSIELMLSVSDLFPRRLMISPPLVLQTRSTIYILVAIPVFPGLLHQQLCVEFFFLPRPTCLCGRLQHHICVTCLCYSPCSSTSRWDNSTSST